MWSAASRSSLRPGCSGGVATRDRRGFALPFLVLLIVIFLGIAAFAIDASRMFVIKSQLQTSADAGAMAGVLQLKVARSPVARDSAWRYTQLNLAERVPPDVAEGDIIPGMWGGGVFTPSGSWTNTLNNAVSVTTHHTGAYYFGRIYSLFSKRVTANAIAAIGSVARTDCVRPLAIPYVTLLEVL